MLHYHHLQVAPKSRFRPPFRPLFRCQMITATLYLDFLREFVAVQNTVKDLGNTLWFMEDSARLYRTPFIFSANILINVSLPKIIVSRFVAMWFDYLWLLYLSLCVSRCIWKTRYSTKVNTVFCELCSQTASCFCCKSWIFETIVV